MVWVLQRHDNETARQAMPDIGCPDTGPLWDREVEDKISGVHGQNLQTSGKELYHQTSDKESGRESSPCLHDSVARIFDLRPWIFRSAFDGRGCC